MNINDSPGALKMTILEQLYRASAAQPVTRQQIAQKCNQLPSDNVTLGDVGAMLTELRLAGYLILENDDGCWLAESYQQYEEWYNTALIPTMVTLLQIAQIGKRAALAQFKAQAETG